MASVYAFCPGVLGRMERPRAERISSEGASPRVTRPSSEMACSTASASSAWPRPARPMSSSTRFAARSMSAWTPVMEISRPVTRKRTWGKPRSSARSTWSATPRTMMGSRRAGIMARRVCTRVLSTVGSLMRWRSTLLRIRLWCSPDSIGAAGAGATRRARPARSRPYPAPGGSARVHRGAQPPVRSTRRPGAAGPSCSAAAPARSGRRPARRPGPPRAGAAARSGRR